MLIPVVFSLGSLRMSGYRVILLLAFLPAIGAFLQGRAGRVNATDIFVILLCLWTSVSYFALHGVALTLETVGIFWIETLGAYFLGRCYVRTPEAFRTVAKVLFIMALIMAPFALVETLTGRNIALQMFDALGTVFRDVFKERRWGLDRVQGPFEHPILLGVFFGSFVGTVYFVLGYDCGRLRRWFQTGLISAVGISAFSSGPLAGLVAEYFFMIWAKLFARIKWRWYAFLFCGLMAYMAVDLISTRNPFAVFVSYLAFNAHTAYNRILIFEWATLNIFENPILGLGFTEWKRAYFMSPSLDMYWLIPGVSNGIPALLMSFLSFGWAFGAVAFKKFKTERLQWYQLGYTCSMFGFFLSGWTVDLWNATYVLLFFFIGSGLWLLDYKEPSETSDADAVTDQERRHAPYSRFRPRQSGTPS